LAQEDSISEPAEIAAKLERQIPWRHATRKRAMAAAVHPGAALRPLDPSRVYPAKAWDRAYGTLPRGATYDGTGFLYEQPRYAHSPTLPYRHIAADRASGHSSSVLASAFSTSSGGRLQKVDAVRPSARSPPPPPLRSPQLAPRLVATERYRTNNRSPQREQASNPSKGSAGSPNQPLLLPVEARRLQSVDSSSAVAPAAVEAPAAKSLSQSEQRRSAAAAPARPRPQRQVETQSSGNAQTEAGSLQMPTQRQSRESQLLEHQQQALGEAGLGATGKQPSRHQARRHSTVAAFPSATPSKCSEVPFARRLEAAPEQAPLTDKQPKQPVRRWDKSPAVMDYCQGAFPNFMPLLEATRDYARLSGCRFLGRDFHASLQAGVQAQDGAEVASKQQISRALSEDAVREDGSSPVARWKARTSAAPVVEDFARRLQAGDGGLEHELQTAFHFIMAESVRNSMVGKCRELDLWPPAPKPSEVDPQDCRYEDTSADLPVIAQRLYNDEEMRKDPSLRLKGSDLTRRRAMLASFLIDFASEVGWKPPAMPEVHSKMMQEFTSKAAEWERAKAQQLTQEASVSNEDDWDFSRFDVLASWKPAGRKLRDLAARIERSFSRSPDSRQPSDEAIDLTGASRLTSARRSRSRQDVQSVKDSGVSQFRNDFAEQQGLPSQGTWQPLQHKRRNYYSPRP